MWITSQGSQCQPSLTQWCGSAGIYSKLMSNSGISYDICWCSGLSSAPKIQTNSLILLPIGFVNQGIKSIDYFFGTRGDDPIVVLRSLKPTQQIQYHSLQGQRQDISKSWRQMEYSLLTISNNPKRNWQHLLFPLRGGSELLASASTTISWKQQQSWPRNQYRVWTNVLPWLAVKRYFRHWTITADTGKPRMPSKS